MKIANVGYQNNYSNNVSKTRVLDNPVNFTSLENAVVSAAKKNHSLSEIPEKLLIAAKKTIGQYDVKVKSYFGFGALTPLRPQNLEVDKNMKLLDFTIKGVYKSGGYVKINRTTLAEGGSLYARTTLKAVDSNLKGLAVSKGDAILKNTKESEGATLKVKNHLIAENSILAGKNSSNSAHLSNTKLAKNGRLDVANELVVGNGSVINGSIGAEKMYLREGSELGPDGISATERLHVDGKINGIALSNNVVVSEKGSLEKSGQIRAEHVVFKDFLPSKGRVSAEKMTIGEHNNVITISKPEDVPKKYSHIIKIEKTGSYKAYLEQLEMASENL